MPPPRRAFVLFAEMRTGSNHLEASLNALPDVTSYGEVFNPTFIGTHDRFELLGYDMDRREHDPLALLDAMRTQTEGIAGFRLFHDHDPRVVAQVLSDPQIAKVILTRNPLDSYVSRKIAAQTGQWRLNDLKHRRQARIRFDPDEFAEILERQGSFRHDLERGLQITGQTAFRIGYDDINDTEVLNGLAAFIGSRHRLKSPTGRLKRQNPGTTKDKVENHAEMVAALARLTPFDPGHMPHLEPPRPAGVQGYVAHPEAGLLFLPIRGAPVAEVVDWMAGIAGVGRDGLIRGMSRKDLRKWMKAHPRFRSFTVLRHPVGRAHDVFIRTILPTDRPRFAEMRQVLRRRYGLPIPEAWPDPHYDTAAHHAAFLAFLKLLKGVLAGQTSLRRVPALASQTAILQGVAGMILPHRLVFEEDMLDDLPRIAAEAGAPPAPRPVVPARPQGPADLSLKAIYDGKIERAAINTYRRDYLTFGFARWNRR